VGIEKTKDEEGWDQRTNLFVTDREQNKSKTAFYFSSVCKLSKADTKYG